MVPAITVAVSVTTLPEVTVVTALPPEVTASVVVVAVPVAPAGSPASSIAPRSAGKQLFRPPLRHRLPPGMALVKALSIRAMEGNRKAKKDSGNAQNHPRRDSHGYATHATEGIKLSHS